ncbi:MAG TPA: Dna2/Cas4 domain-containing protein [Methanothrix sp.]|nr:Dna2/Cas4 domain-containing protein [Methanothrix sp.]
MSPAPTVRISDISQYLRCPRLVYFEGLESLPSRQDAGRILLKSLMLSPLLGTEGAEDTAAAAGDAKASPGLADRLKSILSTLEEELPLVYDLPAGVVEDACRELDGAIEDMARGLALHLDQLFPCRAEVDLYSDRLGLSGRLDRLAPGMVPSIIRTGKAPPEGIWKKDRLALAGYALLLGEKEGLHVNRGLVEYPRSGLVRDVQIFGVDRARVLRLRDQIRLIKDGRLPDRPEGAPCEGCPARQKCESRHSLLSKFF